MINIKYRLFLIIMLIKIDRQITFNLLLDFYLPFHTNLINIIREYIIDIPLFNLAHNFTLNTSHIIRNTILVSKVRDKLIKLTKHSDQKLEEKVKMSVSKLELDMLSDIFFKGLMKFLSNSDHLDHLVIRMLFNNMIELEFKVEIGEMNIHEITSYFYCLGNKEEKCRNKFIYESVINGLKNRCEMVLGSNLNFKIENVRFHKNHIENIGNNYIYTITLSLR